MHALIAALILGLSSLSPSVYGIEYEIDTRGSHAFIQFRISHLGFSWLLGRFNSFEGRFDYYERNPSAASVSVTIETGSIDTNHEERDRQLRGEEYLDVKRFPQAHFVSQLFQPDDDGGGLLQGELTLRGITRPITIEVKQIGSGMDPWGGYRRGFEGRTRLRLKDFGIEADLGPAAEYLELDLYVEGIRQNNWRKRRKR